MKKTIFALAIILAAGASHAQTSTSGQSTAPEVVAPRLQTSSSGVKGGSILSATSRTAYAKEMQSHDYSVQKADEKMVSAYLTVDPTELDIESLEEIGVKVTRDYGDILTVRMPIMAVEAMSHVKGVRYVQTATPVAPTLDVARPEGGVQAVHEGAGMLQGYTGKGIVVGIVDSGFDYGHAAFRDKDGGLRIRRVWEQSTEAAEGKKAPDGFGYGVEFCDEADILAAGGDIFNNSHGTHVTSIAAGADLSGTLSGMAPDADIVLVSMTEAGENNVAISDAIAYIYDYADAVGKPCVVNLSLGANSGPHDGTSTFDVIADRLQGPGRLIVGASGNNRADHFHVHHTFSEAEIGTDAGQRATLQTFINYLHSISEKTKGGDIEIWGDQGMNIEVDLVVYKTDPLQEIERVAVYPRLQEASTISLGRNITGTYIVAGETSPLNDKPHVALTSQVTGIRSGYAIAIEVRSYSTGTVDIWADDRLVGLGSRDIEGFADTSGSSVCEIGGTAKRILTVGAYTTRSEFSPLGSTAPSHLNETDGDLASFSGCGPTADGRMKPQVTAPGCYISAAVSNNDYSGTLTYSAFNETWGRNNYYGFMQGTSMASPYVAGVVATWLEAYPKLTPEILADVVAASARTDEYTNAPSNEWGYGKIDAYAGLQECLKRTGGISSISTPGKTSLKVADGIATLLFGTSAKEMEVSVYNLQGMLISTTRLHDVQPGDTCMLILPQGPCVIQAGGEGFKVF